MFSSYADPAGVAATLSAAAAASCAAPLNDDAAASHAAHAISAADDKEDTDSISGAAHRQDRHYQSLVKSVDEDSGDTIYGRVVKICIGRRTGTRYYMVQFGDSLQRWDANTIRGAMTNEDG